MPLTRRPSIHPSVKNVIKRILVLSRLPTSQLRLMPDFIIIGAQKCGTTSLYSNLAKHPCVAPALFKEVHFFDINYGKGTAWYRAHFPTRLYKVFAAKTLHRDLVVGEASPYYIYHPHAPRRILKTVPWAKLIVMLRNPVDRAVSHYHHQVRKGHETLSFQDAIRREQERLRGEIERMHEDEDYYSLNHHRFSYLTRGIYVDQLKVWMSLFPKEQILIIKGEDFFHNASASFERVVEFLDLPPWQSEAHRKYGVSRPYPSLNADLRNSLSGYFRPHNQRLYEFLGVDFGWEEESTD